METTPFDHQADSWIIDPGPFTPHVLAYEHSLVRLGFLPEPVYRRVGCARHFCAWLLREHLDLYDIDDNAVRRFAAHDCHCDRRQPRGRLSYNYIRRVRNFVRHLHDVGVCQTSPASPSRLDQLVDSHIAWLRLHKGLSDRTVHLHRDVLGKLLPALGDDPAFYDAVLIRSVIFDLRGKYQVPTLKRIASVLRGWLSYLGARGDCPTALVHAVPTIAHWRGSVLPRYLPDADVERLINACDTPYPTSRRDRAILLLLARLGLRAGDVRSLKLTDIDWQSGHLHLIGKGRRETRLPLPQEVGDAILAYLEEERPAVPENHIFLRSLAPYRPFARSQVVSKIVACWIKRAGITNAPSHGAHLLRHSAATSMLRRGATLDVIGTVLRHRSMETTTHYAKVDTNTLRRIAQPWPGDRPC